MAKKKAQTLSNLPPLNTETMENKSDQKNAQNDESAAVDAFFAKNRKAKGDKKKKNKAKASET